MSKPSLGSSICALCSVITFLLAIYEGCFLQHFDKASFICLLAIYMLIQASTTLGE